MMAEMPLNYLGLVIEPHDINAPLPDLSNRSDVRGVLTWFEGDSPGTPAPAALLAWAERAVDLHKRYISLGNLGFADRRGERLPLAEVNHFLQSIGLQDDGVSVSRPIRLQMLKKDTLIGFERPVAPPFPGFEVIRRQSAEAVSHLVVDADNSGQTADLVVTGPNGGYVAPGYTHFYDGEDNRSQQWLIDPFAFFRLAFATDDLPKPDVTTIVGRRIYYSEVDGDGGLNLSEYGQDAWRRRRFSAALVQRSAGRSRDQAASRTSGDDCSDRRGARSRVVRKRRNTASDPRAHGSAAGRSGNPHLFASL